jgi:cell division protein FtsB
MFLRQIIEKTMPKQQKILNLLDVIRDSWFLIAFISGGIYWVARQDSSLVELEHLDKRITSLENRTTTLESGIGQLQLKIDGIKEDVMLIKSAVIK